LGIHGCRIRRALTRSCPWPSVPPSSATACCRARRRRHASMA
jgi:hypothetical protein